MRLRSAFALLILSGSIAELHAQSFFTTPTPRFLAPSFRGTANSEFSHWDLFYSPLQSADFPDGVNYPDTAAPNGTGQFSSDAHFTPPANSNPTDPFAFFNAANPTIAQLQPGAFIIGPGATGNIYSFSAAHSFVLNDTTPYTLGTANLQWLTDGTLIDYSTLKLNYVSGGTTFSLAPTNLIQEYQASGSSFGFSVANRMSAQWNLTSLGITSYTITFKALGSSDSFQEALLDTSATYSESTPSSRAWSGAAGADTKWSNATNWTGNAIPTNRGNVNFTAGAAVQLDSAREVSLLTLAAPGAFAISSTGGAKLQLNSGLTTAAGTTTISAPVTLGSFNLMTIGGTADVTLSGAVDGVAGFYKSGAGTLRLTGSNTFGGQVAVDGGTTYLSNTNTYSGATTVFSGRLILQGNAPSGAAGTLGNATTAVVVGSGGSLGEPEAALVIDGPYTVGRSITIGTGGDSKRLGGQNTGAGAVFSGAVTLATAATALNLDATGAADRVIFSGAITGGAAGLTVAKTGNGTVIFSGANKTYLNDTAIAAGTLQIDSPTAFTGDGKVTVSGGARLLVQGSLGGAGALAIEGGTVGGAGTINRAFTLDTGDVLSPGAGIGTLNTKSQMWAGGGRLQFEINNVSTGAGTGWDYLNIADSLTLLASSGSKFTLEIDSLTAAGIAGPLSGFDSNGNYSWKIATAIGGITGFTPSAFQFDTSAFANSFVGKFNVSVIGNDAYLIYNAVPEPSAAALLLLGATFPALRRRRAPLRK